MSEILTVELLEGLAKRARPTPIQSTNYVIVHQDVRDTNPHAFDRAASEYESKTGIKVIVSRYIPRGETA